MDAMTPRLPVPKESWRCRWFRVNRRRHELSHGRRTHCCACQTPPVHLHFGLQVPVEVLGSMFLYFHHSIISSWIKKMPFSDFQINQILCAGEQEQQHQLQQGGANWIGVPLPVHCDGSCLSTLHKR